MHNLKIVDCNVSSTPLNTFVDHAPYLNNILPKIFLLR